MGMVDILNFFKKRVKNELESNRPSESYNISNRSSKKEVSGKKIGSIVGGIGILIVFAYIYASDPVLFSNFTSQLDSPTLKEGTMADEEEEKELQESANPKIETASAPEHKDLESLFGSITSKITVMNSVTDEPLEGAWIYVDSKDTECITGVQGTFCVDKYPDCITNDAGGCFLDLEIGEHKLLIKTRSNGKETFSHEENISISLDNNDVTINILRSWPVSFIIKNRDSGTALDGVNVYVGNKFVGTSNNGRLSEVISEGSHLLSATYKNQLGREVSTRLKIDVNEEQNSFTLEMPALTYSELSEHILSLINKEREKAGLEPVVLSNNLGSQNHAEEIVKEGYVSFWDTQGFKPYMRYSLYGGSNAIHEKIALLDCRTITVEDEKQRCMQDPIYRIERLVESGNTEKSSRNSILDKWYNRVSIGIAYNDNTLALVQDLERNYVTWDKFITVTQNGMVEMSGRLDSRDLKLASIEVYYDELPKELSRNILSEKKLSDDYDKGELVAKIDRPSSSRQYYKGPSSKSEKWVTLNIEGRENFEISFPLQRMLRSSLIYSADGIYTIYLIAENDKDEKIPLTNYSLQYKDKILSSLDGSELWRCSYIPRYKC